MKQEYFYETEIDYYGNKNKIKIVIDYTIQDIPTYRVYDDPDDPHSYISLSQREYNIYKSKRIMKAKSKFLSDHESKDNDVNTCKSGSQIHQFEILNDFHLRNYYEQVSFYVNYYNSRIPQINLNNLTHDVTKKVIKTFHDKFRESPYYKRIYLEYCSKCLEYVANNEKKFINYNYRHTSLYIVHLSQTLAEIGIPFSDIVNCYLFVSSGGNNYSGFASETNILDWYKKTEEYRRWKKHHDWLQKHPSYTRIPADEQFNQLSYDQRLKIFKGMMRNPKYKKTKLLSKGLK